MLAFPFSTFIPTQDPNKPSRSAHIEANYKGPVTYQANTGILVIQVGVDGMYLELFFFFNN